MENSLNPLVYIKKGFNGNHLKMIAIITMLLDHFASVILTRMLIENGIANAVDALSIEAFLAVNGNLYNTYRILKWIGRIAFPIFCFLLVEGFLHTHHLKKYLIRIFAFALISEIPFDLAILGSPFDFSYQNIYFTLFLGLVCIAMIQAIEAKNHGNMMIKNFYIVLSILLCSSVSFIIQSDYPLTGVLVIVIFYLFRTHKIAPVILTSFILQSFTASFALIPIYLYDGKRGRNLKWFFYSFYPIHLFLLYLLCLASGLGHVVLV